MITFIFQIELSVALEGKFDFSKCRLFTIRGYNKAGLYSTVSTEIKDCSAFDPVLIKPNIVIDAVGKSDPSRGKGINIQDLKDAKRNEKKYFQGSDKVFFYEFYNFFQMDMEKLFCFRQTLDGLIQTWTTLLT